ncbi:cytochrome c oxidase subunit 8B [Takifugu rubripes]|uniref:Cytochrome c oxidase subunit 8B, mitochondrial n=2 Tax=Takifugu TaxID=31032 RepID=A0A3B5K3H6_TAKRU|nr:cytochrome c oxidase subunit 8B, mitochondrial [Takifugu rubripes]XP_056908447.1 cytochrome c oxidase subunit 8B, mitochondrial [Takifugu flavidus]TWW76223.1 Cytochrome c oxidase subunit 8B, mitochondrial [Takifugu flavidus]|eukprot:XP_003979361.1 PREDICTED: cytochrome c oxidase subunit 8B, mitochondrial [Takifugu rubripes]
MSLPSVSRLFRSALRTHLVPAANVTSKPAKHNVTTGEQVIAMTVLFVAILGPSGWILSHLEDYKKKV